MVFFDFVPGRAVLCTIWETLCKTKTKGVQYWSSGILPTGTTHIRLTLQSFVTFFHAPAMAFYGLHQSYRGRILVSQELNRHVTTEASKLSLKSQQAGAKCTPNRHF